LPSLDLVILDLDGTLYSSTATTLGAVERAVHDMNERHGGALAVPTEAQILGGVGSTRGEFTAKVFPSLAASLRDEMDDRIWHWERELIDRGLGSLYPGARRALETLGADGFRLAVATNAGIGYMNHILDTFDIRRHFADVRCAGQERTTDKGVIIGRILTGLSVLPRRAAMVGDRESDVRAAHAAGAWAVGCTWGFGAPDELSGSDRRVASFEELTELVATWP